MVRAYLSRQHFEDVENSCPMVALPADVSRSDERAQRAFETVFAAMVSVLQRSMRSNGRNRHAAAQAVAALCVGGMVVARAMENRGSADALRDACMEVALGIGGWARQGTRAQGNIGNKEARAAGKVLTRASRRPSGKALAGACPRGPGLS